ncbi:hypothetical protein NL108_009717 [Boleophthalmus pectinirostris]|nr:protein regulator of cytokinesis 1b isoform X2 [Boleophthalmus pectinirostris]KAJ0056517.1 hypothetical protein NL108_009717 [Boleophthalmus pectinirostris]
MLLKDVWEEIGIPEEQRLQRTNTVKNHIQGLLDMMIAEEQSLKLRLEKSVESSRREIQQLSEELDLPPPQEDRGQSVLQAEKDLRTRVDFLLKEKSRRMEHLKDLLQQDLELADILGTPPSTVSPTATPTATTLDHLRQHLANQREEKSRRQVQFRSLRAQILDLVSELDHRPDSGLEVDLLQSDPDEFCLSLENLHTLEQLLERLQRRRSDLEDLSQKILVQIQSLWKRLETPPDQREEFNQKVQESRLSQRVQQLQSEVERLERLKMENLRSVSDRTREEIKEFWDKCFCSEEQRLGFTTFYTEEVSERVLEVLEAELQRLKQFYEENRPIVDGVQKWIDQWELLLELERKASDFSRFTNRGGNLLKEERQRTELNKNLPKLERSLRTQIVLWEQTHDVPFLVKGLDFLQFVEQQWKRLQEQKEHEKNQRLLKKARQTEEDMLYGTTVRTPTKRRFIGPSPSRTQNRTQSPGPKNQNQGPRSLNKTKRTLLSGCSLSTNSTLRSQVCRSPAARPPLRPAQIPLVRTPVRSKPALNQDQPETKPGLTQDQKENQTQTLGSVASSYSQFVRDLSESNGQVQNLVLNSTDL